ncbi:MAG: Cysteine--tRNA ligase [Actinobacteria bacterium ADurb.Bin346]|nr:MAG: Cysteine--tRNA ligase [Actinobacteria bacterium ADurb.Bin346]
MIEVKEQKMSKSKGLEHDWILRNVLEKYSANVIKLYMLSTHYRSPLEFSAHKLEESKKALDKIINFMRNIKFLAEKGCEDDNSAYPDETASMIFGSIKQFKSQFRESMDDDFNSAKAIGDMFEMIKSINSIIQGASFKNSTSIMESLKILYQIIIEHSKIFGFNLEKELVMPEKKKEELAVLEEAEIKELIEQRNTARKNKNYSKADEIRQKLKNYGIILDDRKEGTLWKRES